MSPSIHLTCHVLVVRSEGVHTAVVSRAVYPLDEIVRQYPDLLEAGSEGDGAAYQRPLPSGVFSPPDAVLIEEVQRQIACRMAEPQFGVEQMARELALSPRQLRRRVLVLMGESPQGLLRRARVERAEMLLRCGTPSVKEVAYAVGYCTAEGLRRAFVAVRGSPPSAVRAT